MNYIQDIAISYIVILTFVSGIDHHNIIIHYMILILIFKYDLQDKG